MSYIDPADSRVDLSESVFSIEDEDLDVRDARAVLEDPPEKDEAY